ncbi:Chitinase 2 [Sporothrix bragantina]|uniref:Chitinase 2 n=1 Tax=Sporothrix bragantina TaxID=671064 RepID=A0ABP0B4M3_9PEZI
MHRLTLATLATVVAPVFAAGKINVYWGQNGDRTLTEVCQQDAIDYVTLSVVNQAPEQDGTTNYPGMEFAAHCPGTMYEVDGVASNLIDGCTDIIEGIPVCQAKGIRVLLSIGGVFDAQLANYNVTTEANGRYFADFLWGAFGPYNASWTGPRPFDASATEHTSVDGFDFDIEEVFATEDPWIAMIEQLRGYWDSSTSEYLITGAPQCPIVSDPTLPMKQMIAHAQFDLIWVQFYNNPECDGTTSAFNFDQWIDFLVGTRSAHAELYIGLPADVGASGYLNYTALSSILTTYGTSPSFGGVMLWDEYLSYTNTDALSTTSEPYLDVVKQVLASVPSATTTSTPTPSATPSACNNPYTVQPTDDCYDLAMTYDTTVKQILTLNPGLDASCDLTAGQTICLPASCTQYYTVEPGNSCYVIDTKYGITFAQLQAMNPGAIDDDCDNLAVGQVLCVSTGNTISSSSSLSPSVVPTTTTAPSASPVACKAYYTVEAGNSCYTIDLAAGITFDQLQAMNPGVINDDCTNLNIGQVLCVSTGSTSSSSSSSPSPSSVKVTTTTAPSPSPVSCTAYYTVKAGDSCYTIDLGAGLTFDQLQSLNPGVINADCTNLGIGQVLCVGDKSASSSAATTTITTTSSTTLSITSTLTTSTSTPFFTNSSSIATSLTSSLGSNATTASTSRSNRSSITVTPSVSSSSSLPSSSSLSSSTASVSAVPCGRNILVTAGESCEDILARYDLTLQELKDWNPYVFINEDCTNLVAGEVLCVKTVPASIVARMMASTKSPETPVVAAPALSTASCQSHK